MNETITKMVEEYLEEGDFFGEAADEAIEKAETTLGFKFPKEYREFVKTYGSGGICGVDLVGVEKSEASVVSATQRYRNLGLDKNIVVVQDLGEYIRCMDSSNKDGFVYSWDRTNKELNKTHDSFVDFLIDEFQEAIDDL